MDVKLRIIYYVLSSRSQGERAGRGQPQRGPLGCSFGPDDMRRPLWGNKGLATEGGLWEGLSPSATEGGPPLWDCQCWGLLEESSCPKNTHTHTLPSQDTKQMVTSYICLTQPHRNRTKCRTVLGSDRLATFYEFPDRCSEFNTDPQLCTPRGSSVFPLGCYIKTRYVIYKEIFVNGGWTGWR